MAFKHIVMVHFKLGMMNIQLRRRGVTKWDPVTTSILFEMKKG